jgi:hypothetical protein
MFFPLGIYKIKCYICHRRQARYNIIPPCQLLKIKMMKNKQIFHLFTAVSFLYHSCVKPEESSKSDILINELLLVNKTIAVNQNGEYDDWIELYNLSNSAKDIPGYFLSDTKYHFSKWEFPSGTSIPDNGFLNIWSDDDSAQISPHTNFKHSSQGEKVLLSNLIGNLLDKEIFRCQTHEISFFRNPNVTGSFRWIYI